MYLLRNGRIERSLSLEKGLGKNHLALQEGIEEFHYFKNLTF